MKHPSDMCFFFTTYYEKSEAKCILFDNLEEINLEKLEEIKLNS